MDSWAGKSAMDFSRTALSVLGSSRFYRLRAVTLAACVLTAAGTLWSAFEPLAQAPDPFTLLESDTREAIRVHEPKVKAGEEPSEALAKRYHILHDIRNHRTFAELWRKWGWPRNELNVLYVGSGSHVAPLAFLNDAKNLRRIHYTYTEIDPNAPRWVESFLVLMVRRGVYRDLAVEASPLASPAMKARWEGDLATPSGAKLRSHLEEFIPWYGTTAEQVGENPGFRVLFTFLCGDTKVEISMVAGAQDSRPGSTSYYRIGDLEQSDLLVTHDWDSAPVGNFRVLLDFMESYSKGDGSRRLAVMMEDLEAHPFPIGLELFNPVARSGLGYGHVEYVTLPSGERLKEEDGLALYGGGVILEPDMDYFRTLSERRMEAFFNVVVFAPFIYDRYNVDVIGGRRVIAPPILDLAIGYGYRDIRGKDLRGERGFLAGLARAALGFLWEPPTLPPALRSKWCAMLRTYRNALEEKSERDPRPLLACESPEMASNPFLTFPKTRERFEQACAGRSELQELLSGERSQCCDALRALEEAGPEAAQLCH